VYLRGGAGGFGVAVSANSYPSSSIDGTVNGDGSSADMLRTHGTGPAVGAAR
jgi:hypothetical protein